MADSEKIDEQIEAAERKTRLQLLKEHMARIGEGMRGLGTGGVVGARMAGQAVTSAGTVVAPVVIKAKEAKARAAEIAKQHIPPVFIIIAVLGHILDAFTGFHATQFRILLYMSLAVWALFIFKEASNKMLMLVTGISAWMFFAPYLLFQGFLQPAFTTS